jgi:uncharacterized cupredoxin-like copper-binding protein
MMRTLTPAALILAVVVAVAAGCGGSKKSSGTQTAGATTSPAVKGNTITIAETDFKLTPNKIAISKAGTYTINGDNKGGTSHAIAISGNGVQMIGATVAPGGTSTITVDITKPGDYDLYCPVANHKELGMNGTLTLLGSGPASGSTTTSNDTSGGYG